MDTEKKQNGYNTCVFDFMVSNYNGIVKCIKEDFNNFKNYLLDSNNYIYFIFQFVYDINTK